jgi:hypothetical protein
VPSGCPSPYLYVAIALLGMTLWALVNPETTVDAKLPKGAGEDELVE